MRTLTRYTIAAFLLTLAPGFWFGLYVLRGGVRLIKTFWENA